MRRGFLARPELELVEESCAAERALHAAPLEQPTRKIIGERLARLQDADTHENDAVFLRFRRALHADLAGRPVYRSASAAA